MKHNSKLISNKTLRNLSVNMCKSDKYNVHLPQIFKKLLSHAENLRTQSTDSWKSHYKKTNTVYILKSTQYNDKVSFNLVAVQVKRIKTFPFNPSQFSNSHKME